MTKRNLAMTAAWILCCSPQHLTIEAYQRPDSCRANQPEASPMLLWPNLHPPFHVPRQGTVRRFRHSLVRFLRGRSHSLGANTERGEDVLAGLPRGIAARQQCCTFTRRHGPGK